jgi:hypothetical protein
VFWQARTVIPVFQPKQGGAEFSCNSAKEHGALRAGFANIRSFNRLTFMKQMPSSRGLFAQLRACHVFKNHKVAGVKTSWEYFPGGT